MKRLARAGLATTIIAGAIFVAPTPASAAPGGIVGIATTPSGDGHWLVDAAGRVSVDGDAPHLGSISGPLRQPIVGMASTPSGRGYWLVARDGGIFSFGDAAFHGSTGAVRLNQPIVGMASTARGGGYWLVAADGGIFSFGDAAFHGSTGAVRLNQPIVGMASTPSGRGYWLVARDGGIFTFGDAGFKGSTGAVRLNQPIIGMASTPSGGGYWLAAGDGGVFTFGDAGFQGAGAPGTTAVAGGMGYALATGSGRVAAFKAKLPGVLPLPVAPPVVGAPPGGGGGQVLFRTEYPDRADALVPMWQSEQEPRVGGITGPIGSDRIRIEGGRMRVELRPYGSADGDVQTTGGSSSYNRAEVYARHATRDTPAEAWPDPVGSTRWYSFDLFVPADFTFDTTGRRWLSFTQWKGLDSGSPAIALEIKNDRMNLGGASGRHDLGPVKRGQWERLVVGVHFDPTNAGWVEVYRDGQQALGRTNRPTMNYRTLAGRQVVDPTYLKQGLYRTTEWDVTHVLQFGPVTIGTTREAVK